MKCVFCFLFRSMPNVGHFENKTLFQHLEIFILIFRCGAPVSFWIYCRILTEKKKKKKKTGTKLAVIKRISPPLFFFHLPLDYTLILFQPNVCLPISTYRRSMCGILLANNWVCYRLNEIFMIQLFQRDWKLNK